MLVDWLQGTIHVDQIESILTCLSHLSIEFKTYCSMNYQT